MTIAHHGKSRVATQTLGEEYTDIWQHSAFTERTPSHRARTALILLPTVPTYVIARWGSWISSRSPRFGAILSVLPTTFEVLSEINLAIFYLRGTYYDLAKRLLGIRNVCSIHFLTRVKRSQKIITAAVIHPRRSTYSSTFIFTTRHPLGCSTPSPPHDCHEKYSSSGQIERPLTRRRDW